MRPLTARPLAITLLLALATPDAAPAELPDAADVADVPALDVQLDGDARRRYVLIGHDAERQTPKRGYRLLVVLPGGPGSIDFLPFVKRIRKQALTDDWVVAQVVAPVWSPEQAETLVWPTRKDPWQGMAFSSEEFVLDAIADVRKRVKVDRAAIFTLTWSSSGPVGYTLSLLDDTPVTGTFVAMSVFKPNQLPPLSRAARHPYFLLHSPDDFIPIAEAREAETALGKQKAKVKLVEYPGGHGWQGDVFGTMRAGIRYLEDEAPRRSR